MKALVKKVLIFNDAPQLVLAEALRSTIERNYLCLTVECTARETKALCVPVSEDKYTQLVEAKVDLRTLFVHPRVNRWYTTNLSRGEIIRLEKVSDSRWGIKDEWLPAFDFYLEPEKKIVDSKAIVSIAMGRRWDLRDLHDFSHKYEEVYALVYSAIHEGKNATAFHSYPWRRGLSSVLFYKDLQQNLPRSARPVVESINYNSPGAISLSVSGEVNEAMRAMLQSVVSDPKGAADAYHDVHAELQKRKLLGENPPLGVIRNHDEFLGDSVRQLGAAIGFRGNRRLVAATGSTLHAVKILLSLHRRLMSIREYIEQEKVDFKKSFH